MEKVLYPLTHPQKMLWFTEKFYSGTSIANIVASVIFEDGLDYKLLEKAINMLIEKNDAYRLRIIEENNEPKQYVEDYQQLKFDFIDFSQSGREEGFKKLIEQQASIPFKLIDSDLYYFALVKIDENRGGYFCNFHHLITDAWSMVIKANSIVEYYSCMKKGEIISEDKKPSYLDYVLSEAEYMKSKRFQKDKEYWDEKFKIYPELTTIKARQINDFNTVAKRKTIEIPKKYATKIQKYCLENNTSIYTLFLASLAIYLNRITVREDIILGTTVLNRSNAKEKITSGMYASVAVPLRINMDTEMTFTSLIEYLTKENMSLLRHQKYPYDLLLKDVREKHKNVNHLFDIVLTYQNSKLNINEQTESYEPKWHFNGHQVESFTLNINDREDKGQLVIDYDYLINYFTEAEIETIHEHLMNLFLNGIENPNENITNLEMLSKQEKEQIIYTFNNTYALYPKEKTIHELFEERVRRNPDNIAIIFENKHLTYQELNDKSNQLARLLRAEGVKPDTIVGIMVYRSFEMLIGIFAILKAGGAYLPIDPEYPNDRITYMLEDANVGLLLTQDMFKDKLMFNGQIINLQDERLFEIDASDLENVNKPNDLAYIIYTSGSTGKPKGVMIEHHSVLNRINWMQKKYRIGYGDIILQKTPFTFDVSVWELFWWSFVGASVCMLEPQGEKDPAKIINVIDKYKITTMHFVPSMLNAFLNYLDYKSDLISKLNTLKQVFASGEALTLQQVKKFNNTLNKEHQSTLHNLYGPTEATVDVSYFDCSTGEELSIIPIGKPIDNTQLYIVDKNNNLQPTGAIGELCIGGVNLARGYINKPELTSEKFIPNPFVEGERLYKTGDLAKWLPDGNIEYIGRIDNQVKIRGYRIELGEIENKLLSHQDIKDVVVVGRENNGNKYLCAYFVADANLIEFSLKEFLSKDLPSYMIPSYFIQLEKLPLSSNGKLDRKALPQPNVNLMIESNYEQPDNEIQKILCSIWADVLGVEKVGINNNFFSLGGDSLAIIQVLIEIHKLNWGLTAQDFYLYQTVKELAEKINNGMIIENIEVTEIEKPNINLNVNYPLTKIEINNVFLTGATGFLGVHILDELLNNTEANIYCLVRGNDKEDAERRLSNLLDYYFSRKYKNLFDKRIFVINGDITFNRFGLSNDDYIYLGKKVDTIIHASANVNFYGTYEEFKKVNVYGTQEVIEFALNFNIKLNHISTRAVSGEYIVRNKKKRLVFNEDDFYIGQNFQENVYTKSKFEAENLIFRAIKKGLNASILRIGILTGRATDGVFQKNISNNAHYNRIKSFIKLGLLPQYISEVGVEFTPVDLCSKALVAIAQTRESENKVFHLLNHKDINIKDFVSVLAKLNYKLELIEAEEFNERFLRKAKLDRDTQNIILEFNSDNELYYDTPISVGSEFTQQYLKELGFEWMDIDEEYIAKILNNMKKVGFIS